MHCYVPFFFRYILSRDIQNKNFEILRQKLKFDSLEFQ